MSKEEIKSELHKLIDKIDDETLLETFYTALSDYDPNNRNTDIIDELSQKQENRLAESIHQVSEDDTINNDKMKDEISKWFTR
ncbi:MAG: hypothetical protein ABI792_05665 [bacterium]